MTSRSSRPLLNWVSVDAVRFSACRSNVPVRSTKCLCRHADSRSLCMYGHFTLVPGPFSAMLYWSRHFGKRGGRRSHIGDRHAFDTRIPESGGGRVLLGRCAPWEEF